MRALILSCAVGALFAGCSNRPDRSQGNPAQTASVYTGGGDTGTMRDARDQTHQAKSLEGPMRLRGFGPILDRMSKMPLDQFNQNLPTFKQELGNTVDAMAADLTRAGVSEGKFREQATKIQDEVGGGTGSSTRNLTEAERGKFVGDIRNLIQEYQASMRTHREAADSR